MTSLTYIRRHVIYFYIKNISIYTIFVPSLVAIVLSLKSFRGGRGGGGGGGGGGQNPPPSQTVTEPPKP